MDGTYEGSISGVKVCFPAKPYPTQMAVMSKIIHVLNRKENALIESPTGTGKSLAFLCSTLAWQKKKYANLEQWKYLRSCCPIHNEENLNNNLDDSMQSPNISGISNNTFEETTPCPIPPKPVVFVETENGFKLELNKLESTPVKNHCNSDSDISTRQSSATKRHVSHDESNPTAKKIRDESSFNHDSNASFLSNENLNASTMSIDGCTCGNEEMPSVPTIMYCTRTHRQISQVVKEFKKTVYKTTPMSILASREHTCIHPVIKNSKSKNEECKDLLNSGGGCVYYQRDSYPSPQLLHGHGLESAWDIEEIVNVLTKIRICPYFATRSYSEKADIIFAPYNYLIDPIIRNAMQINLNDKIIIVDEGHNLEDVCRDSATMAIKLSEISSSLEECNRLVEHLDDYKIFKKKKNNEETKENEIDYCELILSIKSFLESLSSLIKSQNVNSPVSGKPIVDLLIKYKLTLEVIKSFDNILSKAAKAEDTLSLPSGAFKIFSKVIAVLTLFHSAYKNDSESANSYRLIITEEEIRTTYGGKNWLSAHQKILEKTLHLVCLSPSISFHQISEQSQSVILTSGTLSPMQSFESELGTKFSICFGANHVISPNQAWIGNICNGNRSVLKGIYSNIRSLDYQLDIGEILIQLFKEVPYGILVFFPSYSVLRTMKDAWQENGLLEKMNKIKVVEDETSDKEEFEEAINNYYSAITQAKRSVNENNWPTSQITGAVFLAVVRGKVSEGIDFSDDRARAVVTISIPYPNIKDFKVKLKQEHNNMYSKSKNLVSGNDWYESVAFRALNQALGRCIRHKNDWGIMLMLETRITNTLQYKPDRLPKWFKNYAKTYSQFSYALSSIKEFVESHIGAKQNVSVMETDSTSTESYSQAGGFISATQIDCVDLDDCDYTKNETDDE